MNLETINTAEVPTSTTWVDGKSIFKKSKAFYFESLPEDGIFDMSNFQDVDNICDFKVVTNQETDDSNVFSGTFCPMTDVIYEVKKDTITNGVSFLARYYSSYPDGRNMVDYDWVIITVYYTKNNQYLDTTLTEEELVYVQEARDFLASKGLSEKVLIVSPVPALIG